MTRSVLILVAMCGACQGSEATPEVGEGGAPVSGIQAPAFEFEQVVPDVYHARGTGSLAVGSNAAVIVNEGDVLLVDSHISPAAASALLDELAAITTKPVRYVVNTHFHFDHAHGNQIYPAEVEVIGHEFTREALAGGGSVRGAYERFLEQAASRPDVLKGQEGLVPTPPNTTLSERMTLFRGGREIRLMFFGRGHTGGDVVVHLPAEGILITGDLLLEGLPYVGDGFPVDWVDTLEGLKALEFDVILPGHGRPFRDRAKIDHLQAYLTDLWARTSDAHARGLSAEQAAAGVDMTDHAARYPAIDGPGVPLPTVERIYELLSPR